MNKRTPDSLSKKTVANSQYLTPYS